MGTLALYFRRDCNYIRVSVSDAKARYDDVDQGDEEDDDDDDVIEDVGGAVVGLLVDIQAADDEKEDADNHLRDWFRVRKCEKKYLPKRESVHGPFFQIF